MVPDLWVSQELLWSRGKVEFKSEAKDIINSPQEVQASLDLGLNLRSVIKERKQKSNSVCIIYLDMATNVISAADFMFVCVRIAREGNLIILFDKMLNFWFI